MSAYVIHKVTLGVKGANVKYKEENVTLPLVVVAGSGSSLFWTQLAQASSSRLEPCPDKQL